jgi:hypothetical protein
MVSFLAGGLAANTFWMIAFPADVIKNRIMSQPDSNPLRYPNIRACAKDVYRIGNHSLSTFYCLSIYYLYIVIALSTNLSSPVGQIPYLHSISKVNILA